MFSRRPALVFAGLLILASLAACAPLPPAAQEPAATQAAAAQPVTQSTAVPAATDLPPASSTPAPAPTPAIPNPQADPAGALLYASSGKLFRTAEFTYTMTVTVAPADDASAQALGAQASELKNLTMVAAGSGALEVTDPASMKSKMRLDMDVDAAGQKMTMQMVLIDQSAWVKATGIDTWQKVEGEQAKAALPAGMSPEQMLQDFKDAVDVQWVEDVTQGSETISHLRFSIDPSKLDLASLTSGAAGSADLTPEELQAMFKDMQPAVDVWLAKPSLELRGEKMQVDFMTPLPAEANMGDAKIRMTVVMDMQFSKVNEPVTIEPPTE